MRGDTSMAARATTASFYSLSCETYSGTPARLVHSRSGWRRFYSLSCETYSGTPQSPATAATGTTARFYSLSCETYSGTSGG